MEFRDFEYIIAIARWQSLTKAAEELYITQPSLSTFLKNFEERLGIQIFDRVGKKFVVNYVGERIVREGQKMIHLRKNLENQLSDLESLQKSRFTVGMVQTRAIALIPEIFPKYSKLHPAVEITLVEEHSRELEVLLDGGKIDIGILNDPHDSYKNLSHDVLLRDEAVLSVNAKSPICALAKKVDGFSYPWIDLSLIPRERFIIPGSDPRIENNFLNVLEASGIHDNHPIYISNLLTAVRLVSVGYATCYAFSNSLQLAALNSDNIRLFSIGKSPIRRDVVVSYRKDSMLPEYVTDFIKILKDSYLALECQTKINSNY